MRKILVYPAGINDASTYASNILLRHKIPLIDHPAPEITHLLLDIPSFTDDGFLSGRRDPEKLLSMLPPSITVIGGNLDHPCLNEHRTLDLLKNEDFLCFNAAITAHCAIKAAYPYLRRTLGDCSCAVIGWGRIGKCLSSLLAGIGCDLKLIIRNQKDRAIARSLGYHTYSPSEFLQSGFHTHLLFNTAPGMVFSTDELRHIPNCIKIDLASVPGLLGDDIISARGLPGKLAPESSGKLIAECVMEFLKEE